MWWAKRNRRRFRCLCQSSLTEHDTVSIVNTPARRLVVDVLKDAGVAELAPLLPSTDGSLLPPGPWKFPRSQCRLFVDVLKEVGVAEPAPLSVPERDELQQAAAARRRSRAAKLTGAAAPCTAPAQLLGVS